jgi:hypothetical protein
MVVSLENRRQPMSDAQFATALFAAPFLLLTAIWIVGLTVVALIGDDQ